MSLAEFRSVSLPKLGGLFDFLKPLDVPSGYSPNLKNVRFLPRAVLSRPGFTAVLSQNGSTYFGMEQFIDQNRKKTLIFLDQNGSLFFQDSTTSTQADLLQSGIASAGSFMGARTIFGREFIFFYKNDLTPAGPIRQWNGNINQTGPATPLPNTLTIVDSLVSDANWASATYNVQVIFEHNDGSYSLATQIATWHTAGGKQPSVSFIPVAPGNLNVVSRWVCFSLPSGVGPPYRCGAWRIGENMSTSATLPGVSATTAGVQAVGYPIDSLATPGTIYNPALVHLSADPPGAGVTAADSPNAGSVAVGAHMVWVVFETIFGYLTKLSVPVTWNAVGGKKALVTNIPTGPWYVAARRLYFSGSGLANAMFLSTFRIPDNATTSVEVDFSDTNLLQGTNFDYLTKNFSAPPAQAFGVYGGRTCYWGALNTLKFTNSGFDGGWDFTSGAPMGWTIDPTFGAGGIKEGFLTFAGDAWRMNSVGGNTSGMINNSSIQPLLQPNTAYSASFRAKWDAGFTPGSSINLELFSPTKGSFGILKVNLPATASNWIEVVGSILPTVGAIPSDLIIRCYLIGPVSAIRGWIDHIQVFPTAAPIEQSVIRISNPFDPETFDSTNGFQTVAAQNGQFITGAVQLRAFLYILKERSMHVTYDDTVNPPSLWVQRQIDSKIGNGSPRSLVSSDSIIAFGGRSGAYVFAGARPQKVSQEVQKSWSSANWSASASNFTVLDTENKLIYFFMPLNADTLPKNSMILDYSEGLGQEDDPGPRKWGKDFYQSPITGGIAFETAQNEQAIYLCGNKIYQHTGTDDDGTAIDALYDTAFLKAGEKGQDLFGGCTFYAEGGGGILDASLISVDDTLVQALATNAQVETLTAAPGLQFELYGNLESERCKIRFESNAVGLFWTVKGVSIMSQTWAEQRPH